MNATPDPLRELALVGGRYELSAAQVAQLRVLLCMLAADEQAPTAVRDPGRAAAVHVADSLVALEVGAVRAAREIVDVGSGAGFPGLPLAVALPDSRVWLLDSQSRKCAFVRRAAADAGIANSKAVCARVEEWPEGIGAHDLALARAVGPQPVVLEYAAPLLRLGGTLVDWRGARNRDEEDAAKAVAELLGLRRDSIRRVEPYEGVRGHHLHVYEKVRETPDRFPRRAGMAVKKPLAGDRR